MIVLWLNESGIASVVEDREGGRDLRPRLFARTLTLVMALVTPLVISVAPPRRAARLRPTARCARIEVELLQDVE